MYRVVLTMNDHCLTMVTEGLNDDECLMTVIPFKFSKDSDLTITIESNNEEELDVTMAFDDTIKRPLEDTISVSPSKDQDQMSEGFPSLTLVRKTE